MWEGNHDGSDPAFPPGFVGRVALGGVNRPMLPLSSKWS